MRRKRLWKKGGLFPSEKNEDEKEPPNPPVSMSWWRGSWVSSHSRAAIHLTIEPGQLCVITPLAQCHSPHSLYTWSISQLPFLDRNPPLPDNMLLCPDNMKKISSPDAFSSAIIARIMIVTPRSTHNRQFDVVSSEWGEYFCNFLNQPHVS